MVSRQERKDPREEQKTKGERKDVYQYYYYYPDFGCLCLGLSICDVGSNSQQA